MDLFNLTFPKGITVLPGQQPAGVDDTVCASSVAGQWEVTLAVGGPGMLPPGDFIRCSVSTERDGNSMPELKCNIHASRSGPRWKGRKTFSLAGVQPGDIVQVEVSTEFTGYSGIKRVQLALRKDAHRLPQDNISRNWSPTSAV